jgi:hypothetical protein
VKLLWKKNQLNSEKGKNEVEILKVERGSFLKGSFCPFRLNNKSWNRPNHTRDGSMR